MDIDVPFTVVDSVYTNLLFETIHEVGPDIRAPSTYELSDVRTGVQNVIMRLEPDVDKQIRAMRQIFLYKDRMDSFGSSIAKRVITSLMPVLTNNHKIYKAVSVSQRDTCCLQVVISRGGGDGGNGGANEMGASYSSIPSIDYFIDRDRAVTVEDDRRSRRSPDEQPGELTQTYHRVRKGKEPVQPHGYPTDAIYGYAGFQEVPSSFTGLSLFAPSGGCDTYGSVLNNYGYSSTNTNCPPPPYPSHEPQFVGSDSSRRHRDNPPIINQETINYGDHHYHQPTFYSVSNLGWIQLRHQSSTHNKSHVVLIKIMMTPIRILPVIHFGGDKFLCIMDFRYEFVPNVQ
ncbi:LOW QUALITY PROTEIN: hypothetical protein Cgig2_017162 [Carnegiea gigantea]|uniref:Uncharacterized protein n=1 Tax=Carnegiea gigantea TaxID=171969 RepID=A0A9Q1QCG5_9CARY|nr:LOW QUALITY PROTEIN: hypothetical protein Cgig2_017162 [Carnegiea gigantea]